MSRNLIIYFGVLLSALIGSSLQAQTNSVQLQDGSGSLISSHSSITDAYGAIPATITQGYIIEIMSTYTGVNESYPIQFVVKSGASATNTITLRPDVAVTSTSISTAASAANVIEFNDADWVIIDGRPGGSGTTPALTIANTATSGSNTNTIDMYNGACHNIIQYCIINNGVTGSAARNIGVMESNNSSGNSDNLFQFNTINCGRYGININGSSLANANRRNRIYGCTFVNPPFTAVWIQSYSSNVTIDSCEIYCTSASLVSNYGVILYDAQIDTAIVTKTHIHDLNSGSSGYNGIGINVRSVASGTSSYISFTNNMIALNSSTLAQSTDVVGIEFAGSQAFTAFIAHNTIVIGGTCLGSGTSGNVGSAAVQNLASSTSNVFLGGNNIYINTRTGGTTGLQHVAISLISTSGTFTSDYNTYNIAASGIARLGTTLIGTLSAYQTAVSPNDANANVESVQFTSVSDLHLSGSSLGNSNLYGTGTIGVDDDIDNEQRIVYYRGADEAIVMDCSGIPDGGTITASDSMVCIGDTVWLTVVGASQLPGNTLQWQSRPTGTGSFTDMTNDTLNSAVVVINQAMEYRVLVRCSFSGDSAYSDTIVLQNFPEPSLDSVTVMNNGGLFNFEAHGLQNVIGFEWDFGDGNSSVSNPITHIFSGQGVFEVVLTLYGHCDTLYDTTYVTFGCNAAPPFAVVSVTPEDLCLGNNVNLSLSGLDSNLYPYYTFQWQKSVNGTSYSDVNGANFPSFTDTPDTTSFYRCIVGCGYSGDSTISSVAMATVTEIPSIQTVQYDPGLFNLNRDFNVTFTGSGSVVWHFGDGDTAQGISVSHLYATSGVYEVSVIVSNVCGSDTGYATITILVGLEELEESDAFLVFPNPSNDAFTVSSNFYGPLTAVITDLTGARLHQLQLNSGTQWILSAKELGLSSGVYLLELSNREAHTVKRMVVQ